MLDDKEIQLFDNSGSNDAHAESCIEAANRGLHILCENPMARNTEEAGKMLEAAPKSGVKHMCGFNYRFVPGIHLAKEPIDKGVNGDIYHFYGRYSVFHDIIVTEGEHTLFKEWWPTGHTLGWDHPFIHEWHHLLDAIVNEKPVDSMGATLEDGYRNTVICDAMLKSSEIGKRVEVVY